MNKEELVRRLKRFSFEKLFRHIRNIINGEHRQKIPDNKEQIVDGFHKLFHLEGSYSFKWCGATILKYPTDLVMYQEIIYETKPDLIIECGTSEGGSTLFMAHLLDIIGNGKIVSIDIYDKNCPKHDRITYLIGKSTSKENIKFVENLLKDNKKVMVILDSDHDKKNVLKELEIYSRMVSKGCYLIVDDTNLNGHPINKNFGAGPYEAVEEFMKNNNDFIIDKSKERMLLTGNPNGFLRKVK